MSNSNLIRSVTFSSDGFVLKGMLHMPPNKEHPPLVIGSHGLLSDANSPKQIALAEACNDCGIAYFRFDHRGCGKSDGVFREVTSFQARCNDLLDAVKAIRANENIGNCLGLFGSSMGGAASLFVSSEIDVDAVVTLAAPICSRSVSLNVEELPIDRNKMIFDISDRLSKIHNILIFHGDMDKVIPVSHAYEISQKAQAQKRLIILNKGDHPLSGEVHQKIFMEETIRWFRLHLIESQNNIALQ